MDASAHTSASTPADTWDATKYGTSASFVYSDTFTSPILDLLDAKPGEWIVDFGCGSGEVTRKLMDSVNSSLEAPASGGRIVGIDSSSDMVSTPTTVFHRKTVMLILAS